MKYRPQIKTNSSGTVIDLPIDAESVKGKDITTSAPSSTSTDTTFPTSKAVWDAINSAVISALGDDY